MAGSTNDDEGEITAINVTPLVDITLVLLIIFMVTTSKIVDPEGMRIDKPDAATGNKLEKATISLVCHADGRTMVDGRELATDAEVLDAIKSKLDRDTDLQGVLSCDEKAEVGAMVRLLDLLRKAGVKKYAIATERPEAPAAAAQKG